MAMIVANGLQSVHQLRTAERAESICRQYYRKNDIPVALL
jgi:hypothetical protein